MSDRADNPRPGHENPSDLPAGWILTTLGQACEINPRKPPADMLPADSLVTFVPMAAVDEELGAIVAPVPRGYMGVRSGYTAFAEGDVIVAKITPCMENGKAAVARGLINGLGFGSTEFHVLRPTGVALAEYLYHYVRQESFRESAQASMAGAVGQLRVPASFLEEATLPLPPLAEQRRIVAQVEALLTRQRIARKHLTKVISIVAGFRRAVLESAASGHLTADWREGVLADNSAETLARCIRDSHLAGGAGQGGKAAPPTEGVHTLRAEDVPETWTVLELAELCTPGRPITYGILKPGPDTPGGVPYVRVADFPKDQLNVAGMRRTSNVIAQQYRRSALHAGDLLLSIRGTVGRVCRVPAELEGANITQDTARISVHRLVNREYIEIFLRAPSVQQKLLGATRGVAVRGVNLGDVRALQVPVPPPNEGGRHHLRENPR